ncbi:MAG: TonB-dependent receptor, partial [Bacteroidota bacterium]
AAGWGSGAVAGAIHLANEKARENQLNIRLNGGAFGTAEGQLHSTCVSQNQKWTSSTSLSYRQAINDFSYQSGGATKRQTNAEFEQWGGLQAFYFSPKAGEQFTLRVWGQKTARNLPPRTVQRRSEASQRDDFLRINGSWDRIAPSGKMRLNLGLFRETNDYGDPQQGIRSVNRFWRGVVDFDRAWFLSHKQQLSLSIMGQFLQGETAAYNGQPQQWRVATLLGYQHQFAFGEWRMQLRQEQVDGDFLPFLPATQLRICLLVGLNVHVSASRNYRLPTFNDLYWNPGGTLGLQPERGWSQEIGLRYAQTTKRWSINYAVTVYHRHLKDWIQWAPTEESAFWTARNLTRVRSRGREQRFKLTRQAASTSWSLQLGHDYVRSTNEVAILTPRLLKGEQLWYTPEHQVFGLLNWTNGKLSFSYQHRWTSAVLAPNVGRLPAYQLGEWRGNWNGRMGNLPIKVFAKLGNAWNANYRVVEYRAMPGRYGEIGCQIQIVPTTT